MDVGCEDKVEVPGLNISAADDEENGDCEDEAEDEDQDDEESVGLDLEDGDGVAKLKLRRPLCAPGAAAASRTAFVAYVLGRNPPFDIEIQELTFFDVLSAIFSALGSLSPLLKSFNGLPKPISPAREIQIPPFDSAWPMMARPRNNPIETLDALELPSRMRQ